MGDNTTPMNAKEYDKKINATIPYYQEFYDQTLDIIEQCGYKSMRWLDLGCGTGTLEQLAFRKFKDVSFVLVDPSEKMLEQAKEKLNSMFNLLLHIKNCDPENTFCDEEEMYAQIAEGLEVTEMRIGTM